MYLLTSILFLSDIDYEQFAYSALIYILNREFYDISSGKLLSAIFARKNNPEREHNGVQLTVTVTYYVMAWRSLGIG